MDFRGEQINWLMVAIPSGRYFFCLCRSYYFSFRIMGELTRRENHQGGAFALLRRLSSFVDEQLVKPGTGGHCSMDRPLSSLSVEEEGLAGISSLVHKTCHLGRKVERIRRVWDAHRFLLATLTG